ncbi:DNA (cytosine-5-)-methyltransferase [Flavobacteriaceae bacterium]|nr:DNA (cytosine-5-)-methyltransferase [Flavobacteriaceae bacterium]MDC1459088.1 DNA (cytosine-5-)-methyltransferase [Flavobacteriaceae bacterium]
MYNPDEKLYSISELADILGVTKETLRRWDRSGKLKAIRDNKGYRKYPETNLKSIPEFCFWFDKSEHKKENPKRDYSVIELFAGAGGMALGFEKSGLKSLVLNEIDKYACETLRNNRPKWNILEGDVKNFSFSKYKNKVDIVSGGFPCQAFSYAGKKLGFEDTRGTLFFEFARVVKETMPKICVGENVRGLFMHDSGKTLKGMVDVLDEIGYKVISPKILKAIFYKVPQKRERVIIVGVRKDLKIDFTFPKPVNKIYTMRDVLFKGDLYDSDVPESLGSKYPNDKKKVLKLVPQGGYWRDLPLKIQKKYMGKSFYLGGGKTGMARRLSLNEPSLTVTTSPAQKQTERCHPIETRPLQIREYARVQTFPDNWMFSGSISQQYKQIGNAVPVNLAYYLGCQLVKSLNSLE